MSTRLFNMRLSMLLILFALIGGINCGYDDPNYPGDSRVDGPQLTADQPVNAPTPHYDYDYELSHAYNTRPRSNYDQENSTVTYGTHESYPSQRGRYYLNGQEYYV
ncbi:uncharacterized protein LOC126836986 [Adelges cooleyi]|uniref:uncharacterized protein LOC126836986 n=1 Tax=Adelges cooleyi TaxID=133065 RepID=UPI00217F7BEA|nr:uncharacterized protein LOC126836986 [Adelges cooleyi]